jgi:hypothetical protein
LTISEFGVVNVVRDGMIASNVRIIGPNGLEVPHGDLTNVRLSVNANGGVDITSLSLEMPAAQSSAISSCSDMPVRFQSQNLVTEILPEFHIPSLQEVWDATSSQAPVAESNPEASIKPMADGSNFDALVEPRTGNRASDTSSLQEVWDATSPQAPVAESNPDGDALFIECYGMSQAEFEGRALEGMDPTNANTSILEAILPDAHSDQQPIPISWAQDPSMPIVGGGGFGNGLFASNHCGSPNPLVQLMSHL